MLTLLMVWNNSRFVSFHIQFSSLDFEPCIFYFILFYFILFYFIFFFFFFFSGTEYRVQSVVLVKSKGSEIRPHNPHGSSSTE